MIAIISFKSIPGKRFEVVGGSTDLCIHMREYCYFFGALDCQKERIEICKRGKQFREIKEVKK